MRSKRGSEGDIRQDNRIDRIVLGGMASRSGAGLSGSDAGLVFGEDEVEEGIGGGKGAHGFEEVGDTFGGQGALEIRWHGLRGRSRG